MNSDIPILHRREIEARVIQPIYKEMVEAFGEKTALEVLSRAIASDAIAHGKNCAETQEGKNDIAGFVELFKLWTAEEALTINLLEETNHVLSFNVTRCRYAEMYDKMGISEIGAVLSCGRDGNFCKGYNPDLTLERSQTIMRGASFCDFRYQLIDEEEDFTEE